MYIFADQQQALSIADLASTAPGVTAQEALWGALAVMQDQRERLRHKPPQTLYAQLSEPLPIEAAEGWLKERERAGDLARAEVEDILDDLEQAA